jgi:hypothetical protein
MYLRRRNFILVHPNAITGFVWLTNSSSLYFTNNRLHVFGFDVLVDVLVFRIPLVNARLVLPFANHSVSTAQYSTVVGSKNSKRTLHETRFRIR